MRNNEIEIRFDGDHGVRLAALGSRGLAAVAAVCVALSMGACYEGGDFEDAEVFELESPPDDLVLGDEDEPPEPDADEPGTSQATCGPTMSRFPTNTAHNIGYDHASCGTGTCEISCPDQNANSDHHNGIDIFAFHGAELAAVADGQIVASSWNSERSGLRVRLRDACGWEYYYGHLEDSFVHVGQWVKAGEVIGSMGNSGSRSDGSAYSTHLHFNASADGGYYDDKGGINATDLLKATSATACGGAAPPAPPAGGGGAGEPPPPPPPEGCGVLLPGESLAPNEKLLSCDGRFQLQMQTDGNLVLRVVDYVGLWDSKTYGNSPSGLVMQDDGNLVVYSTEGTALWHIGTHGNPGAYLRLQDDGNLVVYRGAQALWNTGTNE